jgi:hypothetical protein
MKKLQLAPYCVALAVGNCVLPFLLSQVAECMRMVYQQNLGDGAVLWATTQFALAMPLWFYLFALLSILAGVGLYIQRVSVSFLVQWLLAIAILECIALSCFAWGICSSFFGVFWNVGK